MEDRILVSEKSNVPVPASGRKLRLEDSHCLNTRDDVSAISASIKFSITTMLYLAINFNVNLVYECYFTTTLGALRNLMASNLED